MFSSLFSAQIVYSAATQFGDIDGRLIADLGCGCGTFALAASLLGSGCDNYFELYLFLSLCILVVAFGSYYRLSIGIDIDPSALEISQENASELSEEDDSALRVDWLAAHLMSGAPRNSNSKSKSKSKRETGSRQEDTREWLPCALRLGCFDTVLMNPPFGIRSASGKVIASPLTLPISSILICP